MSMIGEFREITPGFLLRLQAQPSLAEAIFFSDFAGGADKSDLDVILQAMPLRQREELKRAMIDMPPEIQQKLLEQSAKAAGALRQLPAAREAAGLPKIEPGDLGAHVNIQKAWHGLHFLLCGSVEATPNPLGQAVLGGTAIGPDIGYGPVRYLDASDVVEVDAALEDLSPDDLRRKYDADAMRKASVYPEDWEEDIQEHLDWLIEAFEEVVAFYRGVSSRRNAALLYLT